MSSLAEQIARDVVCAKFPGRLWLTLGEALTFAPSPPATESAVYQRLMRGTYPFPTEMLGGRRVVTVVAIARAIAGDAPIVTQKRRRGRPRKASRSDASRVGA